MPGTGHGAALRTALLAGLLLAPRGGLPQVAAPVAPAAPAPTVAFELVVEDAGGRPVTDLRLEEVEVIQDATKQKVRTFRAGSRPGLYEITYVPFSGKPGGVTARVTRRGTVVRGPDGPSLKPRLLSALSPLEAELVPLLEARAGSSDLACDVAVFRFERVAKGVRHAVAVEIPLAELRFDRVPEGARGRLQVLARITPVGRPGERQHVTLDQAVEAESGSAVLIQRLVWTGTVVIAPGRHTVEVLVRDPATDRATTRTLAVDVPPPTEGLSSSSVVLLRPRSFFFLRDQAEGDDPLIHEGAPLMPSLRPVLQAGADTHLRFFVALYPVAGRAEPVSLKAELLRDGTKVGEAPIPLPKPEPSGEIRYVGLLATASFPAGAYALRLVARQGATAAAEEAAFDLSSAKPVPPRPAP
ncbi:MAG TPA: hypothetical protein VGB87_06290 [Vicinamibacteria bacterium]